MAELAGTLVDTLLRRVRDPSGLAHSRDFARSILSAAQRMVNAHTRSVLETVSFTTTPRQIIYPILPNFPDAVRIEAVREDGRDLHRVDWRSLVWVDGPWFRRVDSQFRTFSIIGRDLLVIYPAQEQAVTVDVVYTKLTADLVDNDTATELSDDDLPAVVDLAESLLLLRQRDLERGNDAMKRLAVRVGIGPNAKG